MREERKKVLIFTTAMGHLSLAQAAKEVFDDAGWETKVYFSEFTETNLTYKPIYLFFPTFQKSWVEFTKNKNIVNFLNYLLASNKKKEVEKAIRSFKPDMVFSTYFLYNNQINHLKKKYNFVFINLLANAINLHPLEFAPEARVNIAYDEYAIKAAKKYKLNYLNIKPIGWLTRKKFYANSYSNNLSLPKKETVTILLCGGSWGANRVIQFLPSFLKIEKNFRLILVAGSGKLLYKIFSLFKKSFDNKIITAKGNLDIEVFAFTDQMPKLMHQSDIIVGKAGPNLLFESIAAGKPFIAISHISGTEDGSLKLIKEKSLGWVAEKPREFTKILKRILKDESLLVKSIVGVRAERSRNISAGRKLIKIVKDSLGSKILDI